MKPLREKRYSLMVFSIFTMVSLLVSVSSADELVHKKWNVTIGFGASQAPDYEGSDNNEATIYPYFEVLWKDRIFLNPNGFGINYYQRKSIILNAIISQSDERDESLNSSLKGLGDIDSGLALTLGGEAELGPILSYANLTKHLGGTKGIQMTIGLETAIPLLVATGNWDVAEIELLGDSVNYSHVAPFVIAGLSAEWVNDDYAADFFSVDAVQSARSGLPQHKAESGLKTFNFELSVLFPVDHSWMAQAVVGCSTFVGDVKYSPIVENDSNFFFGGLFTFHF